MEKRNWCTFMLYFISEVNCISAHTEREFNIISFRSFVGISIKECQRECYKRPRCLAAVYRRRFLFCQMSSTNILEIDKDFPRGIYITNGVKYTCGGIHCANTETCEVIRNESICKVKECVSPGIPYTMHTFGNIFDVESRLKIMDETTRKNLTIFCGSVGAWYSFTKTAFECSFVSTETGIYWLAVANIPVYCDMDTDGGHWMVFQRRKDGSVDFFRNWKNYTNGFGDITGEFWMGLNALHLILSDGFYELRIDLEDFEGERRYAKYSEFNINGPEDNFRLNLVGYSGDAGDSMELSNNMSFTTKDVDNDNDNTKNCAHAYYGGWWYNGCHRANLNGQYIHHGGESAYAKYIHWVHWKGYRTSLKRTEMKLRRTG